MKRVRWIALVAVAGLLAASIITAAADGTNQTATGRLLPAVASAATQPGANVGVQQVSPAQAGNRGIEAADAAVGSLLSLSSVALAAVFGSRWLLGRRR